MSSISEIRLASSLLRAFLRISHARYLPWGTGENVSKDGWRRRGNWSNGCIIIYIRGGRGPSVKLEKDRSHWHSSRWDFNFMKSCAAHWLDKIPLTQLNRALLFWQTLIHFTVASLNVWGGGRDLNLVSGVAITLASVLQMWLSICPSVCVFLCVCFRYAS